MADVEEDSGHHNLNNSHHHHNHHHNGELTVDASVSNGDDEAMMNEHEAHLVQKVMTEVMDGIATTLSPPLSNDDERTPSPVAAEQMNKTGEVVFADNKAAEDEDDQQQQHHRHNHREVEVIVERPQLSDDEVLLPPPAALLIAADNNNAFTPTSEEVLSENDWPSAPVVLVNAEEEHEQESEERAPEPEPTSFSEHDHLDTEPEDSSEFEKLITDTPRDSSDHEVIELPHDHHHHHHHEAETKMVEILETHDEPTTIVIVEEDFPRPMSPLPPPAPASLVIQAEDLVVDAPKPPLRHRRTPSMPIVVVEEKPKDSGTPQAPRRHKKTSSLVEVEAKIDHHIHFEDEPRRSKTAEPGVELDDIVIVQEKPQKPVPPERRKKGASAYVVEGGEVVKNDDKLVPTLELGSLENSSTGVYQKIEVAGEPLVVTTTTTGMESEGSLPVSPRSNDSLGIVTQEQLVAELKDVLRKKNRYVEVVPDSARHQRHYPDSDHSGGPSSQLESDQETSVTIQQVVVTDQPIGVVTSSASPRRVVEVVIVGDGDAQKKALCHSLLGSNNSSDTDVSLPFTCNCVVDGTEVALIVYNVTAQGTAPTEPMPRVTEAYRKADVVVGCFSQNNAQSLENLRKRWLPEVRSVKPNIPVVLAAERHQQHDHAQSSREDRDDDTDSSSSSESSTSGGGTSNNLSLAECQAAAREIGAAAFIEYHNSHHTTQQNNNNQQQRPTIDVRQVFEAAVKAYNATATSEQVITQQQTSPVHQMQPEEPPKRKKCCNIL